MLKNSAIATLLLRYDGFLGSLAELRKSDCGAHHSRQREGLSKIFVSSLLKLPSATTVAQARLAMNNLVLRRTLALTIRIYVSNSDRLSTTKR